MSQESRFANPFGEFTLLRHARFESAAQQNLRAWDAADELLLNYLADLPLAETARVLVINDAFGALTCALIGRHLVFVGDSFVSQRATRLNMALNGLDAEKVDWHHSLELPQGPFDVVIMRVPKSLALLEDQLCRYQTLCNEHTVIVAAGMVKHLAAGVFRLFERYLDKVSTSLAAKKARLIFARTRTGQTPASPYPKHYRLAEPALQMLDHANVFSAGALDIGSRFFLPHIPSTEAPLRIADLGCGNGLLGIVAAQHCPQAQIDFYDESFMALASAQANFRAAFPEREARYIADDAMAGAATESYDLVLCNPPFHQGHVVGDFIARQMFEDAFRTLKLGGELRIVGNRHLGYAAILRKLFGGAEVLAVNPKFVVVRAVKKTR